MGHKAHHQPAAVRVCAIGGWCTDALCVRFLGRATPKLATAFRLGKCLSPVGKKNFFARERKKAESAHTHTHTATAHTPKGSQNIQNRFPSESLPQRYTNHRSFQRFDLIHPRGASQPHNLNRFSVTRFNRLPLTQHTPHPSRARHASACACTQSPTTTRLQAPSQCWLAHHRIPHPIVARVLA